MTQVAVLAGGLGTRLRPLTETCPKPLVEVAGRPFLEWQLREIKQKGFERIVLLVAYLGEMIEARFGDGEKLGLKIKYVYEREPLGTGGALRDAAANLDDVFLLLNGDSFLRAPLAAMAGALADRPSLKALVSSFDRLGEVPVPANLRARPGPAPQAVERYERGGVDCDRVDSGVYAIRKSLLERAPRAGRFQLEDLWPEAIARGELAAYPVAERFYDIGDPERLRTFEAYLARSVES